jgi:NitT/TauT family transport system substrate-binding protein
MISVKAVIAAAMLVVAGMAPASAQQVIKVGTLLNSGLLPTYIARDKGLFEKHGLAVELDNIRLIANVPPGLLSGSLQMGYATTPNFLSAVEAGLDFVAVAGSTRQTKAHSTVSLIAAAGSGITSAADLKGKRVGTPGLSGIFDVLFRIWLAKNGVDPNDVTQVEVGIPQTADALKAKTVDAVLAIEPIRSRVTKIGLGTHVSDFMMEVADDVLSGFFMAERGWAKAHVAEIRKFRAALDEATAIVDSDPAYAAAIEKKYFGATSEIKPAYSTEITVADLKLFSDMGKQLGQLKGTAKLDNLIVE